MKFFVLTKRRLTMLGVFLIGCAAAGVLTGVCVKLDRTETPVAQAASTQRQVPIYCVDTQEKKIAISFDAAWGNEQTDDLIDILDDYNVKTTFFVVGDWAEKYPESVKALSDAGHEVCNHSNTHPHMPQLTRAQQTEELQCCNEKIAAITGQTPKLFRPPYGDYSNDVLESAKSCGMYTIQWDVDSLDWKNPTVEQMVERVTSKVQNGSIVLFHNGAENTPQALPLILQQLQSDGYTIVPVSELIYKDGYHIDATGKQIPETE
ncbi:MAG: polysaccharide deacetylase family protein [Oscillospiraceae bacterium]|nr:polysaccharide deacetylase family protein [Oscillospiraceae bacterium]